jgi:hypoxanthine phosphoribosyltransferase
MGYNCGRRVPQDQRLAYPERKHLKVLLNEREIGLGIDRLATQLKGVYGDRPLTVVAIMTGSLVMLADLIRRLEMPVRISLIQVSSYRGGMNSGDLVVQDQMTLNIRDRDVLLIDDIFDTGRTLVHVTQMLVRMEPASIKTAVFLNKLGQSVVASEPDFVVFEIPNEFVVGYGLDYQDLYRNLPYVGVLEDSDLRQHAEGLSLS